MEYQKMKSSILGENIIGHFTVRSADFSMTDFHKNKKKGY